MANRSRNYRQYQSVSYDGNAVRKTDIPEAFPRVRIAPKTQQVKAPHKAQSAKQKKAAVRARVAAIVKILFVALAAFSVLVRGLMLTETTNRIEKKEKELSNLVSLNEKTRMEIDHSLDLNTVEGIAAERLGLSQQEKYQTVYVDLNQVDHVEKIRGKEVGENNQLKAFFKGAKEYLD